MKQPNLDTETRLLAVGLSTATGATQVGATIGLVQNTGANIQADVTTLTGARDAHKQGVLGERSKETVVRSLAATCTQFAMLARDVLKPLYGNKHSQVWDQTGFVGSLQAPGTAIKLQLLMEMLKGYFTANPSHENAALNITATRAGELFNGMKTALLELNTKRTEARNLSKARVAARKKLRRRLRALFAELSLIIDPNDEVYLTLGLNKPGAVERPEMPEGVIAMIVGPTMAAVKWSRAPRAEYYRVWIKVNGVDQELRAVGNTHELDFAIEELPVNSTIEVAVSAVNSGGESATSEVVTIQTA